MEKDFFLRNVYLKLNHFAVQQKITQHESTILQFLKSTLKAKKNTHRWQKHHLVGGEAEEWRNIPGSAE